MLISFDYLFKKYNIDATGVLHVGASEGQEAEAYYKNGIQQTIWIEAIGEVFQKLKTHLQKFHNWQAYRACISDTDGEIVSFNIANNDGQSSSLLPFETHSQEHPTVKFIDTVEMVTRRIDTLLKSHSINPSEYTFLNIDLQGAELLALKGMGKYLDSIKYAYIEVNQKPLYRGCPMVEEIDEYLLPYGLKRVETNWTPHGWGDSLFIKQ